MADARGRSGRPYGHRQFSAALLTEGAQHDRVNFFQNRAGKIVCEIVIVAAAFSESVIKEAGVDRGQGLKAGRPMSKRKVRRLW